MNPQSEGKSTRWENGYRISFAKAKLKEKWNSSHPISSELWPYPWLRQYCSLPNNRYATWLYVMHLLVQVLFWKPTVFAFPPFSSLVHTLIIFHLRTFWPKCFRFLLFPSKLRQQSVWSLLSDHISLELFLSWILKAPFISHSLFSYHSLSVQSICSRARPEWYISTEHALQKNALLSISSNVYVLHIGQHRILQNWGYMKHGTNNGFVVCHRVNLMVLSSNKHFHPSSFSYQFQLQTIK